MKSILFVLSLSLLSMPALACKTPSARKVSSIVHNLKTPTYWRTVKGRTYNANTAYPALATVLRRIEKSYVEYDGEVYTFEGEGVVLCDMPASNQIEGIHPRVRGTITRTGSGDNAMLTLRSGVFTMRVRPAEYVR